MRLKKVTSLVDGNKPNSINKQKIIIKRPEHRVIIGHDFGAAVWIQAVKVNLKGNPAEDVIEMGKEISVDSGFFKSILKPMFLKEFDPEIPENKLRYTYAFSVEGRHLTGFEEDILEHNYFTH